MSHCPTSAFLSNFFFIRLWWSLIWCWHLSESITGAECLGIYFFFSLWLYSRFFSADVFSDFIILFHSSWFDVVLIWFFYYSVYLFHVIFGYCLFCNLLKLKYLVPVVFYMYVHLIWIFCITGLWLDLVMLLLKDLKSNILEFIVFLERI